MSRSVRYEELTADEIRKLDAYGQVGALSWLYDEIGRLANLKMDAIGILAEAKAEAILKPSPAAKATVARADGVVKKLGVEISSRRQQVSILQSLLRSIPH